MSFPTYLFKFYRYLLLVLSAAVLFLAVDSVFFLSPSLAAKEVAARYGFIEQSLPVEDLRTYAETSKASSSLQFFLNFLSEMDKKIVKEGLQVNLPLDVVAVDKLLDTEIGQQLLSETAKVTVRRDNAGSPALRSAIIESTLSPKGLGVISFLEAYPSKRLTIDLSKVDNFISAYYPKTSSMQLPQDNLSYTPIWQLEVQYQMLATSGKQYTTCLFGDSISAGLGNSLSGDSYNFALNGLSTISLIEQLKILIITGVKCKKAIVAIGTNDAMYGIKDDEFIEKMSSAIAIVKSLGTKQIFLIPAFYSTVAASLDPQQAGTIKRVDEINALLGKVAVTENVPLENESIQPLFKDNALKENLTRDGVHLNNEGLEIYRQALLKILN